MVFTWYKQTAFELSNLITRASRAKKDHYKDSSYIEPYFENKIADSVISSAVLTGELNYDVKPSYLLFSNLFLIFPPFNI